MLEAFAFIGWCFANVVIPLFAPLALLPLIRVSLAYRVSGKGLARRAIQEGQLFWTVIAMSASACHLIGVGLAGGLDGRGLIFAWVGLVWHTGTIVLASALVLVGATDSMRRTRKTSENALLVRVSIIAAALTSVTYSLSQFLLHTL